MLFNVRIFRRAFSSLNTAKKRTCLYDFHIKNGAKMVDFAGFAMPAQYNQCSLSESVKHTRAHVSIFDVSHMLQTEIRGSDRESFIESLAPVDVQQMPVNSGALGVLTNPKGGVIDDLIVAKTDRETLFLVTNAARIDVDLPYLQKNAESWRSKGKNVQINVLDNRALIAVQGPEAAKLLQTVTDIRLEQLYFMQTTVGQVCGFGDCRVSRCGYTGEDGFEISMPAKDSEAIVEHLLKSDKVGAKMAGLGARDVLRIEAGLCLYGNELDEQTTPVEAGISFVIAKRRRATLGFPGAERIMEQLERKTYAKKRVGLEATKGGRAARGHMPVVELNTKAAVGIVTSGCPSPSLGKNIAMAYVDKDCAKVGTTLGVDTGTGVNEMRVVKMPFLKTNYFTKECAKS